MLCFFLNQNKCKNIHEERTVKILNRGRAPQGWGWGEESNNQSHTCRVRSCFKDVHLGFIMDFLTSRGCFKILRWNIIYRNYRVLLDFAPKVHAPLVPPSPWPCQTRFRKLKSCLTPGLASVSAALCAQADGAPSLSVHPSGPPIPPAPDSLVPAHFSETGGTRRLCNPIFKVLGGRQSRILYLMKLSFDNEEEMKTFSDKRKFKTCVAIRSIPQSILKDVLQAAGG